MVLQPVERRAAGAAVLVAEKDAATLDDGGLDRPAGTTVAATCTA